MEGAANGSDGGNSPLFADGGSDSVGGLPVCLHQTLLCLGRGSPAMGGSTPATAERGWVLTQLFVGAI